MKKNPPSRSLRRSLPSLSLSFGLVRFVCDFAHCEAPDFRSGDWDRPFVGVANRSKPLSTEMRDCCARLVRWQGVPPKRHHRLGTAPQKIHFQLPASRLTSIKGPVSILALCTCESSPMKSMNGLKDEHLSGPEYVWCCCRWTNSTKGGKDVLPSTHKAHARSSSEQH